MVLSKLYSITIQILPATAGKGLGYDTVITKMDLCDMKIGLIKQITFALLLFGFYACSNNTKIWVSNGTTLHGVKFKLAVSDSSEILQKRGNLFSLISPSDSLITEKFNIAYSSVSSRANKYFLQHANQEVTTTNFNITEYYRISDKNVFFIGYSSDDSSRGFTVFEPPLTIASSEGRGKTESSRIMKTFNPQTGQFETGNKMVIIIQKNRDLKIKNIEGKIITCTLKKNIIKQDRSISYGSDNLIVPEAVVIESQSLVDNEGLPIAEWSIKKEPNENSNNKFYIELTKYYKIRIDKN